MWKPNRFGNEHLNHSQADGLAADIANARAALDALEKACATEHPNHIKDHVNDVTRWMSFAAAFCDSAAIDCDARREKRERIARNAA